MLRALRMLFAGVILVVIDVRIGSRLDLLPDVLGGALIVAALATGLRERHPRFGVALWASLVAMGVALVEFANPGEGVSKPLWVIGVSATTVLGWAVLTGIAGIAETQGRSDLARSGELIGRLVFFIGALAALLGVVAIFAGWEGTRSLNGPEAVPALLIVGGVLVLGVWALMTVWRAGELRDPLA